MARSAECCCERLFTCRHCLQNAKPYFFTGASGVVGAPLACGGGGQCHDIDPDIDPDQDNGCPNDP
jgi:hypothetical protein